jgi:hypothetical protein
MPAIVAFIDGRFRRALKESEAGASAFALGLIEGMLITRDPYTIVTAYVLPRDDSEMRKDEPADEVERALVAIGELR